MTKDVAPNDSSIFERVRNASWVKDTYSLIKKRGHWVYTSWKRSGLHNGDLKTLAGTTDWCLNFCDGNKWCVVQLHPKPNFNRILYIVILF